LIQLHKIQADKSTIKNNKIPFSVKKRHSLSYVDNIIAIWLRKNAIDLQ